MNKLIFTAILAALLTTVATATAKESPSQVGYSDGLADCKLGYQFNINQHSNAGSHSDRYIDAYNAGFVACSPPQHITTTAVTDTIGQSASQHTTCIIAIGSCGATTAQSAGQ